jgi:acyl-CoA synthetase (NDP forming)
VRLSVVTHQGARQAFTDLARASGRDEVYVQRMGPPGTSCVFAVVDDPSFGSLLSFGPSGMASELLGDRAYRVLPLSTVDAAELVRAPRAAPLLAGYRGDPPVRMEALEDVALRLSRLIADLPEVRALVLDPVLAGPEGAAVAGSRIVLGPPPARENLAPRRISGSAAREW